MCAVVCGKHEEVTSDASVKRDYDAQGLSPAKRAEKRGRGTPGDPLHVGQPLPAPTAREAHLDLVATHGLAYAATPHGEDALGRLHRRDPRAGHVDRSRQDVPLLAAPQGVTPSAVAARVLT